MTDKEKLRENIKLNEGTSLTIDDLQGGLLNNGRQKQALLVFFIIFGHISIGSTISFPSVAVSDIERYNSTIYGSYIHLDDLEKDMIGSMLSLGALPGAWGSAFLMARCGRRITMVLNGLVALIGWAGVALFPQTEAIIFARTLSGLVLGGVSTCSAAYIMEVVDDGIRGVAGTSMGLSVVIGQLLTDIIGYFEHYYTVALINCIFPAVFMIATIVYAPESPTYLVIKGKSIEARNVLRKLRSSEEEVDSEIVQVEEMNNHQQGQSVISGLLQPQILKSMAVVTTLFFVQVFCGFMVFVVNTSRIFKDLGSSIDENLATIIAVTVQVLGGFVAVAVADKLGRRRSLILSLSLVSASVMGMALYSILTQQATQDTSTQYAYNSTSLALDGMVAVMDGLSETSAPPPYGWVPLACLVLCLFSASLGIQPVVYVLASEYFPTWIRPQASSICISMCTIFQFTSLQLYTPMLSAFTAAGLYFFYGCVALFALPFTYFCVKETMGTHVG